MVKEPVELWGLFTRNSHYPLPHHYHHTGVYFSLLNGGAVPNTAETDHVRDVVTASGGWPFAPVEPQVTRGMSEQKDLVC